VRDLLYILTAVVLGIALAILAYSPPKKPEANKPPEPFIACYTNACFS
jgi:hypothetical protein